MTACSLRRVSKFDSKVRTNAVIPRWCSKLAILVLTLFKLYCTCLLLGQGSVLTRAPGTFGPRHLGTDREGEAITDDRFLFGQTDIDHS